MLQWQAELGVKDEEEESEDKITDKDRLRHQKLLRTIYTVPFSQKLSKIFPFLKFLPFYPR